MAFVPSARHRHPYYVELQYMEKGRAKVNIGGKSYIVKAGDVLVFQRGAAHDIQPDGEEGAAYYTCGISGLHGKADNQLLQDGMVPVMRGEEITACLQPIFHGLYEQLQKKRPGDETVCYHLLRVLLIIIREQVRHERAEKPDYDLVWTGRRYIEMHFQRPLNIPELSHIVHSSTSNFAHQFRRKQGISPLQYLIRCRVGMAQNLLRSSTLSISEVGRRAGYDHPGAFNYHFRRMIGMTPGQYRKYCGLEDIRLLEKIDWYLAKVGGIRQNHRQESAAIFND
jgi:AraC-like DNA-binding protein